MCSCMFESRCFVHGTLPCERSWLPLLLDLIWAVTYLMNKRKISKPVESVAIWFTLQALAAWCHLLLSSLDYRPWELLQNAQLNGSSLQHQWERLYC